MPLFEVTERRCYDETTIIDAIDHEHAQQFQGEILEVFQTESWGEELLMTVEREDA